MVGGGQNKNSKGQNFEKRGRRGMKKGVGGQNFGKSGRGVRLYHPSTFLNGIDLK